MTNVVLNGNAYSDDGTSSRDMQGGGHRQWLLPMLGDAAVEINAPVQGVLDAAAAADASATAAGLSADASAQAAQDALDTFNAADALGSGWTAVTAAEPDGVRTVLLVTDWVGGKGPKPPTGYVGATGLVATASLATNLRGAVDYAQLTGAPLLGTAAAMSVPAVPAAAATESQVVRGDDPRLEGAATRGMQTFAASQNIAKSLFGTANYVFVELWGGGGSGGAGSSSSGGEGGEYASALVGIAALAEIETLVIGAGGSSVSTTGANTAGLMGGNSTWAGLSAIGGLGGRADSTGPSKTGLQSKNGGDGGGQGSSTVFNTRLKTGSAGASIMGGGGGAGVVGGYLGGVSQFGGNGGNAKSAINEPVTGNNGLMPSGGGGTAHVNSNTGSHLATSGAGGDGQARLTWW